jgi:NADPH:quinone reductase-like Zn-dependent oxidoreductase
VYLPVGYRLERAGENVVYQAYLNVTRCRNATLQGGTAATLYEVELKHFLDQLPWLEVYAAVPRNVTQYYSWLYNYYTAWRGPPAVGLTPRVGADTGFVDYVKAEWALVHNATSGVTMLYAAAPPSALYILVVDYPLKVPLACPQR